MFDGAILILVSGNRERHGMTIRITCTECASVLKIKDELAGTSARCPKCKTKFVVPKADEDEKPVELELTASPAQKSAPVNHEGHDAGPAREEAAIAESPSPFLSDADSSDNLVDESGEQATDTSTEPLDTKIDSDWDDDDLDSPSVLVGGHLPEPSSDSVELPAALESPPEDPKKKRAAREALETAVQKQEAAAKSSRQVPKKKSDQGFDPVQFLMDDSPAPRSNRFSPSMQDDSDLSLPDDSDYEMPSSRPTPLPTPPPKTKSSAPAASSRPTPEKVDLASAAKMMKKAIKDAQSDSARQRQLNEKPKFDYTLFFREIGLRGLAIIVGCVLFVAGSILLSQMIYRSVLKTPPLAMVRGTITLDGKPVSDALIFFSPRKSMDELAIKGSKRDRERTSVGVSDMSGHFRMMYSRDDQIEGVAIGNCHVWVTHLGPKGSDVPFKWTEGAITQVEVKADSKPFNIEMVSDSANPSR
jgi:hypothetical protein